MRACSRLGRVALGLMAVALEAPFQPVPLLPFPALGWTAAPCCTHAPRPRGLFLRAGPSQASLRGLADRSRLKRCDGLKLRVHEPHGVPLTHARADSAGYKVGVRPHSTTMAIGEVLMSGTFDPDRLFDALLKRYESDTLDFKREFHDFSTAQGRMRSSRTSSAWRTRPGSSLPICYSACIAREKQAPLC